MMMKPSKILQSYTAAQIGEALGVHSQTVYKWKNKGGDKFPPGYEDALEKLTGQKATRSGNSKPKDRSKPVGFENEHFLKIEDYIHKVKKSGTFRVRKSVKGELVQKTFTTLKEAQAYKAELLGGFEPEIKRRKPNKNQPEIRELTPISEEKKSSGNVMVAVGKPKDLAEILSQMEL